MIETIAAYVAVIEFVAKVAKYGSRLIQDSLSDASVVIENDASIKSVEEARRSFERILMQKLGTNTSRSVLEDMQVLEQILSHTALQYKPSRMGRHAIIPHATILRNVLAEITRTLGEWHCFELWGERHIEESAQADYLTYYNLLAPKTMKGIRKSGILSGYIKMGFLLQANAYFERHLYNTLFDGVNHGAIDNAIVVHRREYCPQAGTIYNDGTLSKDYLKAVRIRFRDPTEYKIWSFYEYRTKKLEQMDSFQYLPLTYAKFQPIFLGMLLDFLAYSQRIRQQAAQGQNLLDKLFTRLRG